MQIEKRLQIGLPAFCDHPAGFVLHEAIDEDPVVSGNLADAFGGELEEGMQRPYAIEAFHHLLHRGQRIGRIARAGVGSLELQTSAPSLRCRLASSGQFGVLVKGDPEGGAAC